MSESNYCAQCEDLSRRLGDLDLAYQAIEESHGTLEAELVEAKNALQPALDRTDEDGETIAELEAENERLTTSIGLCSCSCSTEVDKVTCEGIELGIQLTRAVARLDEAEKVMEAARELNQAIDQFADAGEDAETVVLSIPAMDLRRLIGTYDATKTKEVDPEAFDAKLREITPGGEE